MQGFGIAIETIGDRAMESMRRAEKLWSEGRHSG